MSRKFTPSDEQQRAISARDSALLISAGAGSGKTRVLTERLLSYLNDVDKPCDVSEFLIITYTRAAAAELRERIGRAISDELSDNPNNRRLRRQSALVYSAHIDTIHGFCGDIIRENAHFLELSPDFRVLEASDASDIAAMVMERLLDDRYEAIEEFTGFENLVDSLSPGRNDERLGEIALSLYEKLRSHHDGRDWLNKTLAELNPDTYSDVSETRWGRVLTAKAIHIAEFWNGRLGEILAEISDDPAVMKKYGACCGDALNALQTLIAKQNGKWDGLRAAAMFETARPAGKNTEEGEKARSAWSEFTKEKKKIAEVFYASSAEIFEDQRAVYAIIEALFALVEDFTQAFTAEKKRRNAVDFSDLEHYALKLLTDAETGEPTKLAIDISRRFKEIMVDEYQDVSMIQERIFGAVSRNGVNLVTVGDMRQSIYRFRLAEPSIFQNKYDTYPEEQLVRLTKNFRSREAILGAVNFVFSNVMSREYGEMEYVEKEYLHIGAQSAAGGEKVELAIIAAEAEAAGDDDDESDDAPKKREVEARYIAGRIRELTQNGGYEFKDCVILLRALSDAGIYRAALTAIGIPVVSPPSESYFDSAEVELALAFLAVIDNPLNDIPLAAVLCSRLYSFTPDELADIRVCLDGQNRDCDFFVALEAYSETSEKAQAFLSELSEYRALAPEYGAERILWRLYNRAELPAAVSAMPQGAARRDNLMRLIMDARRAAAVGVNSVAEFLRYIGRLRERGVRLPDEAAGSDNAVRVMTIHKSKGLEFPVVFIADCSRQFRRVDEKEPLMFHRELGVGLKRVDLDRKIAYSTLPRLAIAEKLNGEMLSEELRVLYVAMTRACERLIITYADKSTDKLIDKLTEQSSSVPVSTYILASQRKFGNILLLAALSPRGEEFFDIRRVTATEVAEEYEKPLIVPAPHSLADAEEDISVPEPFVYAYPAATDLPSKLTVTELKNRALDSEISEESETALSAKKREYAYKRPGFISDLTELTGAERGTALHLALRRLELREYSDETDVCSSIDELTERGLLTKEQADAADAGVLLRFFHSDLGMRAIASPEVFREFKFSLLVPAERFFEGGGEDEILFQGVVDLAFRSGDTLTIVDFKSDRLYSDSAVSEKTALYAPQLSAYAEAMKRVTGVDVSECVLYFLDRGIAVPLKEIT